MAGVGDPAPGAGDAAAAVLDTARTELAAHKRPKRVLVVDSLPKNSFGKVDKQVLRAQHAGLMNGIGGHA